MFQNKYNIKSDYETSHFGNGWGLYVDIEKLKYNFPANHEILRKKYDLQCYGCCENCNDYCCVTKIDINMPIEKKNSMKMQFLQFIRRIISSVGIIFILTYFIFVI